MKKIISLVGVISILSSGCVVKQDKPLKIPGNVITVHKIVEDNIQVKEEYQELAADSTITIPKLKTKLVYDFKTPDDLKEEGKFLTVNMSPEIHSRNIKEIKIVESDYHDKDKDKATNKIKFYDVYVKLNRQGLLLWEGMAIGSRAEKLAFVVDGIYYKGFYPKYKTLSKKRKGEWKYLVGPVTPTVAEELKKLAPYNYKHYNKFKRNLD